MTGRLDGLVLAQRHHLRHSVRRRIAAAVNQDRRGLPLRSLPDLISPVLTTADSSIVDGGLGSFSPQPRHGDFGDPGGVVVV